MQQPNQLKKATSCYSRLKDLVPNAKHLNVKVIVLSNKAAGLFDTKKTDSADNVNVLIADETACVNFVIRRNKAAHLTPGDILRIKSAQCALHSKRIFLWGGSIERIGSFTMLFKESNNMSLLQWIPDPNNANAMIIDKTHQQNLIKVSK